MIRIQPTSDSCFSTNEYPTSTSDSYFPTNDSHYLHVINVFLQVIHITSTNDSYFSTSDSYFPQAIHILTQLESQPVVFTLVSCNSSNDKRCEGLQAGRWTLEGSYPGADGREGCCGCIRQSPAAEDGSEK